MTALADINCVEISVVVSTKGYVEQLPVVSVGYLGGALGDWNIRRLLNSLKEVYPKKVIQLYEWNLRGGVVPPEVIQ